MKSTPLTLRAGIASLAIAHVCLGVETAHWPRWRGPADSGSASAPAKLPTRIDANRVLWKAPLPGKGCSTPIVANNTIYVTAPVGGKDALLAFDLNGKPLWQTTLGEEDKGRHRNASGANPSPVTDGQTIFVTFKSGNFAALNLDGSIRWQTNLVKTFGPVKLFWDFGTSPTLTEKHVVMARMHNGESWLAAFDKATGKLAWKTARNYDVPNEVDNGYTTPLVMRHEGKEALLTWGAEHVTVHDAASGKLLSTCGNFGASAFWPSIASPLVLDDVAVVCFGRADRGQPRLHAIKLGGSGDVTKTHKLWSREDVGAFVPTPAAYNGKIYVLSDRGQVDAVDPKTGKSLWTQSLPRSSSNYYASPLVANGVLYAAREDGAAYAVQIDGGFKVLSETKFDDRVIASIVPAGNRLLVRGEANLYCLGGE